MTHHDSRFMEPRITSEVLGANILLTAMFGRVTLPLTRRTLPQFRRVLESTFSPSWIINALAMTGFDPDAVSGGTAWFSAFRAQRGAEIVFVSIHSGARMAARALGFGSGIKITLLESSEDACSHVGLTAGLPRNVDSTSRSGEYALPSGIRANSDSRLGGSADQTPDVDSIRRRASR
jgi:hypothetical protein